MNKEFLQLVGLEFYNKSDFYSKAIQLRDGRQAILWIHRPTGHGLLDKEFWPKEIYENYYQEKYRQQHSIQSNGTHVSSEKHYNIYREVSNKQYQFIKTYLTSRTKYLEIGPSFGGILSRVVDTVAECHVVEPNVDDVEYITKKHPSVKTFCSKLEDTKLDNDYYDVIVSIEVLEHMISVKQFLKSCFNTLKENGNLILEVPNHNDVLLSCYKTSAYKSFYYHDSHIHYFTDKSLINICKHLGFIGEVESFQIYPFFNHVNWCLNDEPQTSGEVAMSTPIPTDDLTLEKKSINNFYKNVEKEYDKLINRFRLGGELIFRGIKNGKF